ncbi:peptide deformylase [uncultured Campylobacter sp.]|uniref:peptide deformylase n=1 Tax=uncultured Campylobacter sp. TaxID=218934 RepID=UPI002622656B|nr:peptide deformylase [uncultured Campylobacter sp.]
MILPVLTYPNPKLYEKSKKIDKFDEELHSFLEDMYETMIEKKGIGLAAIQVGQAVRALIVNLPNEEGEQEPSKRLELINPVITKRNGEILYQEGCLSVPGFYEDVKRAKEIVVEFQDRHGKKQSIEASELLAVCIQHEIDHLDGHLFIEHIGYNKRKKFDREFKKRLKK